MRKIRSSLQVYLGWCLLPTVLVPPSAAAQDLLDSPAAWVQRCEPHRLDAGDPSVRPLLVEGFFADERDPDGRTFAWAGRRAEIVWLLGSSEGDRRLRLHGRAGAPGQSLELRWNDRSLGARPLGEGWGEVSWDLLESSIRSGLHRVTLLASTAAAHPPDPRRLAVALDRLELLPPEGCGAGQPVLRPSSRGVSVPPGGGLGAVLLPPPSPRLLLGLRGTPGARVQVLEEWAGRQRGAGEIVVPSSGRVETEVPLDRCCQAGTALAVRSLGPGAVALDRAELVGDRSGLAWRLGCRLPWIEGGLLALAFAALGLGVRWARRREARLPGARFAPWLDAFLVALVALAARLALLAAYPELDPGRLGDTWEYLYRVRRLLDGSVGLLDDPSWHAWQTWSRPPGYYLFLALVLGPLDGGLRLVTLLQAALGAVAASATYLMAYPLWGRVAALAGGLLFALYVEALVSASWILTESLYMAFLVPGLAALAWTTRRASWRPALLAGVLLGLAILVRSAPLAYVPLAAGLLMLALGWRRGRRPAAAFVGAVALVVVPWCVRNSLVFGHPASVDDVAVANFLQVHPDPRYVPVGDLDLETPEGFRAYYDRLKRANGDHRLSRRGGAIVLRGLVRMAANPGATLDRFRKNLVEYFDPFGDDYLRVLLAETRPCRLAFLTDLLNAGYGAILVLGAVGMLLHVRLRASWPLALWFLFSALMVTLVFYPDFIPGRFRLPTLPVMAAFAGAALAGSATPASPRRGGRGSSAGSAGAG